MCRGIVACTRTRCGVMLTQWRQRPSAGMTLCSHLIGAGAVSCSPGRPVKPQMAAVARTHWPVTGRRWSSLQRRGCQARNVSAGEGCVCSPQRQPREVQLTSHALKDNILAVGASATHVQNGFTRCGVQLYACKPAACPKLLMTIRTKRLHGAAGAWCTAPRRRVVCAGVAW